MLFEPLEDRRLLTLYVVTSLEDGITDGDGKLTLREALLGAETNLPSGDAIAGSATEIDEIRFGPQAFAGGLDTLSLTASLNAKGDAGPLRITGPGRDQLTIDGGFLTSPIFKVFGEVTISGLTLTDARQSAVSNGTERDISTNAEFDVAADIVLEDVHFLNNRGVDGGAVRLSKGSLVVRDSRSEGNSTAGKGGAIFVERSDFSTVDVLVEDTQFVSNSASGRGGAIANENSQLTILRSEFGNNTSSSDGGAIASNTVTGVSSTRLFESTLDSNSSNARGGGLFASGSGEVVIGESTLSDNTAGSFGGGAAFVGDLDVVVRSTWATENRATRGGGLYSESDSIDVDGSTLSTNTSSLDGGGLAVIGSFTMVNSTLSQNSRWRLWGRAVVE